MVKKAKRGTVFALSLVCLLFFGLSLWAAEKKLRVVVDQAAIYLNPDEKSPVLDMLGKGTVIGMLSPVRMKTLWYYVSYQSASGGLKSGYIKIENVEPLFQAQKIITIKGEDSTLFTASPLSHLEPGLWSLAKEKIMGLEGPPDNRRTFENFEVFEYRRNLKDYEAYLEYIFSDDTLIQVRLELKQVSGAKNDALRSYDQLKNFLAAKFGPPFEDMVRWENPTFRYDELSWGYAVSLGHLIYQARWVALSLELELKLRGENKTIFLEFEGIQPDFKEVAKKIGRSNPWHF